MELVEVRSHEHIQAFHALPRRLYAGIDAWVEPIHAHIEARFDPKKNDWLQDGKLKRWLAINDTGEVVGRNVAFYHRKHSYNDYFLPTGGIGFFECVDDTSIAHALFDVAKDWLTKEGLEAMNGPVNCGQRNEWWGLLVQGFDRRPCYSHYYHLPYYRALFESYGFKVYFEQYTYWVPFDIKQIEKQLPIIDRILARPHLSIKSHMPKDKSAIAQDIATIFNEAWKYKEDFMPLTIEKVKRSLKQLGPLIRHPLIWIAYYKTHPIGMMLMMPEINPLVAQLKGRFGLFQKLWLLIQLRLRPPRELVGITIGVMPRFQGSGVVFALMASIGRKKLPYDGLYLSWIGNFNPKMIQLIESIGGKVVKTHHTYRKLFDPKKPFERHPIENY